MLEQVLAYLNNWFLLAVYEDTYTVEGGGLSLPFLQNGQYFRIMGSVFNDGLYQYDAEMMDELTDETFDGAIWALAVPKAVIKLAAEIAAWQEKNGETVASPYTSESFGGYSYTKAANESTGAALTWQGVFAARLNAYKKAREVSYVMPPRPPSPPLKRPYNIDYPWG